MKSEMRSQGLIVFSGALICSLLILLLYMAAPGQFSQMHHTTVTEFYSNSAPPSIPKWASSRAARGVTLIQPAVASDAPVLTSNSGAKQ